MSKTYTTRKAVCKSQICNAPKTVKSIEIDNKKLGQKVRELRATRGLVVRNLEFVRYSTVTRVERGYYARALPLDVAIGVAASFNITLAQLLDGCISPELHAAIFTPVKKAARNSRRAS